MASLQELLAEEVLERGRLIKASKTVKFRDRRAPDESIALPIYICRDRKSFEFSRQKSQKSVKQNESSVFSSKRVSSDSGRQNESSVFSSKRVSSDSGRSNSKSLMKHSTIRGDESAIDEVAIRAVISVLSGYMSRYVKDETFRETIKEKCISCLMMRRKNDSGVFANMEVGIESIDKLVEDQGTSEELRIKSLRNSIRLLSIVASLNSNNSRNASTCGVPNSHLSSCAHLYLSIIYKLEKNDRISARHLLQVFCDSPFLARTHLLPDLWEHFFLPHLLHLKVWYHKEIEFLSNLNSGEKERRKKALSKAYDEQMDMGTTLFALYYREWLKVKAKSPVIPTVPLPSIPSYGSSRRKSSDSYGSQSSINKKLHEAVFGPTDERPSRDLDHRNRDTWRQDEEVKVWAEEEDYNNFNYAHNKTKTHRRSASQNYRNPKIELWPETQKSDYFRFFSCQNHEARNESIRKEKNCYLPSSDLTRAISTICSSHNLSDCEIAIQVITKAWLDSNCDPAIEAALSKAPVIEGMLEVLFISTDDEILELAISILAEFASRNDVNKRIILNLDPQLEIFTRLLSSCLFLKAAVLLYLLKPKAKQMISAEWVALVLRVLEFGDQLQTLFTVRCSPQVAAFYFLEQLLTGFNEDRNLENASEVVSLGGLSLLVRSIEEGDIIERNNAALMICCCIRADANCRNFLAENLNKVSLLELIVLANQKNLNRSGFALLIELLSLNRITQIIKFLEGLKDGWGGLNTMHIFLVYLQKASLEERPLLATILLQLDLLGDPLKCSVYRQDAIEAIIAALDCQTCNEMVQEQSAKALMMLGGSFSYTGESTTEKWILEQAGLHENSGDSFHCKETIFPDESLNEEEEAAENWQNRAATALLSSGNERLLVAISNSIADGIPSLAQASLFTVAWISKFINSVGNENFRSMACSILMPQLLESSNYDRALKERVLATFSLKHLVKCSENVSMLSSLDRELLDPPQNHR